MSPQPPRKRTCIGCCSLKEYPQPSFIKNIIQGQEQNGPQNFCLVHNHILKHREKGYIIEVHRGYLHRQDKATLSLLVNAYGDGVHSKNACDSPECGRHG